MAIDKLQEKIRKMKNPSMVDMTIDISLIPPYILQEESSELLALERYGKELMDGLKTMVPAVRFHMGQFSLLGPDGLWILERLTRYAQEQGFYVALDAPESLSGQAAERAAQILFDSKCLFYFDALVVSAYAGSDCLKPYVKRLKASGKDLFVVLRTANKSAAELQDLLTGSRLVHMAAADVVNNLCDPLVGKSGYSQVAMIGPASVADVLKKLRTRYQKLFMLIDGYDYSNANAKNCSFAFDKMGHGAIACAGSSIWGAWKADETEGLEATERAVAAAERMKKNLTRYVTVL